MNLSLSINQLKRITGAKFKGTTVDVDRALIQNIVIDSRSPRINQFTLFIALKGNKTEGTRFVHDFIQKSGGFFLSEKEITGIEVNQFIVANPLKALQQLAAHHRTKFHIPVIGITGSNGKTTVKEWLYHALKNNFNIVRSPKSYNSQIGVPLSVLEIMPHHTLGIFEAGISQPGEMEHLEQMIQPTIGVFTGIGDAHNSGFSGSNPEAEKKMEKFKLFANTDTVIAWDNDRYFIDQKNHPKQEIELTVKGKNLSLINKTTTTTNNYSVNQSKFASNAGLTALVSKHLGVPEDVINKKLNTLPEISMRLEKIRGRNNNLLINDAYTIDAKSLEIGLHYLHTNKEHETTVLFIAEDTQNNQTLLPVLAHFLQSIHVDHVVYFGDATVASNYSFIHTVYATVDDFLAQPREFENSTLLFTGSRNAQLEKAVRYFLAQKHITRLQIDVSKVRQNLNYYRAQLGGEAQILAMVKAQSYGGGIVEMSKFLATEGVHYFGVAYADEGLALKQAGISQPVLVMNPEPAAYNTIIDYSLEPSIYSIAHLDAFIHQLILKGRTGFPIHIKLETGMNRLGFNPADLPELIALLKAQPEVYVKSVFSHFAVADDVEQKAYTLQQIAVFKTGVRQLQDALGYPFVRHIANSSGVLNYPQAHFDMVRLGIGLYGLIEQEVAAGHLQQAIQLTSELSQVRMIETGESVGYGRNFVAKQPTRVGIIPVGYGDGFRRSLGEVGWYVILKGKPYPLIGNVCMDACMVDITDAPEVEAGERVQLFGEGNSVFEMAKKLGTIPYEIISTISTRVQRVYADE